MIRRGRFAPGGAIACALACAAAFAGTAWAADTIEVSAGPVSPPAPSQGSLWTSVHLDAPAFVGTVLLPGALSACPADYAQAMEVSHAYSVLARQEPATSGGALASAVGEMVTLPAGSFSLCGWIQPEGDTPSAAAGETAGPAHITVGGPGGSTAVLSPAGPVGEDAEVSVSYSLNLLGGEVAGVASATIGAWAEPLPAQPCTAGAGAGAVTLSTPQRALGTIGPPLEGTATFSGRLAPGRWQVCSYMSQVIGIAPSGVPNLVEPTAFGFSSGVVTVLGAPRLNALRARPRVLARGTPIRLRFTLDQASTLSLRLEQLLPRRRGGRCLTDPLSSRRRCGRLVLRRTLELSEPAGADALRIAGTDRGRALGPGLYLLAARPSSAFGTAAQAVSTVFAIR